MAVDYLSCCIDEISLEGLDGICIDALWLRLKDREPQFPLALDDKSKSYLWRLVCVHNDLTFYELPTTRGELVLTDRFKHTDPNTGIFLEQENYPPDIYPLEIISDKTIIGSCTTYKTRKDVTDQVRSTDLKANLTLEQVEKRWGRKLAIVASAEARAASLYGPEVDPSLILPEKHYCILERIGRARRQGELTHGRHSLLIFKEPSKTIFYLRKVLVRHKLITVQPFNQKLANGTNGAGKCLHLRRFFVEYKPIYLGLLENLTLRLLDKPNHTEALTIIRSEMNMRDASFKKLYQFGQKYVKTEMIPHRNFYPESTKEEYMIKVGTKERFIRVLTLKKLYKYSSEAKSDDEDGSDNEDENGTRKIDKVWNRVVELPLLHQAYQFARSKGEKGASQSDFRQAFRASKLDGRLMARNLDRLGMVKTILQDQGKQRVQMFVAKEYIAGSALHKKLQIEKDKIVKLTLPKFESREMREGTPLSGIASPGSSRPGTPQHFRSDSPMPGPSENTDPSSDIKGDSMVDMLAHDDAVPLIDTDNSCEKYHFRKRGAHVTYRLLKRANYILQAVQEAKLVDNIYQIQKKIIEDEAEEGYTCRCDKKSLVRLIERLARDGQIKSIKTLIKYGNEEKQLHFLCDPSISSSDQIVTSAIEAAKLRHIAYSKEFSKEIRKGEKSVEPNLEPSDLNIPNYGLLKSHLTMDDMQYDSDAGRRYGYKPRMLRLQMIHQLFYYLVYTFDLEAAKVISETVQSVPNDMKTAGNKVLDNINDLKVYLDELTWKRFIPPLPKHRDYEDGWCLIGDVLLRLPVSIFCQIIRVNFKIAGLEELLGDPVGRYLTVGKLPSHMRQQLMIERKYIFSFYSNCISLCLMGLITFGKREWKQKEQIFIHVNRCATLVDTTETDEPIDQRPEEPFEFLDPVDIDSYWFRLQWICLNTPLDAIVLYADPTGTNHSHALKIERFNTVLEGHLPEDVHDDGVLPGNKLGAGGLDSTFFAHLRRNWSASSGNLKAETLISEGKRRLVAEGRNVVKKPRKSKKATLNSNPGVTSPRVETVVTTEPKANASKAPKTQGETAKTVPEKKTKVVVKKVTMESEKPPKGGKGVRRKAPDTEPAAEEAPPPTKRRRIMPGEIRVYKKSDIDAVDRAALKRMTKERVMWTPQEDSLLLLCEVASSILGGMRRDFLVQFTIVRDLMHRNFTTSLEKTSKACQRRIRYIMKNSETIANVNMYKGEALQDMKEMTTRMWERRVYNYLNLVDEFLAGKKYSRTPKNTKQLNKVFIDLVERLREKFKTSSERAPLDLPDTLEEVAHRYTLSRPVTYRKSKHKTVSSEYDVHFSVLHNAIHSAMVIQDKSGHANELYHVFSQYPDDLLQAVFNQMRADGIVTKIKAYAIHKETSGKRTMPGPSVAIGNYQMAQRYTYKWFSRYRKFIFLQAYALLDKLCSVTTNEGELIPTDRRCTTQDRAKKTLADIKNNTRSEKIAKTAVDTMDKSMGEKTDDTTENETGKTVGKEVEKTTPGETCKDAGEGASATTETGANTASDGVGERRCTEEGENLEKAWRTKMMPLRDEGVYVALIVSLMVQRKCLMETTIPDQVIVVESQCKHMSKNKVKGKKKLADLEKELHLGTASDEEEEALIEEAEKARLQQEGNTGGVGVVGTEATSTATTPSTVMSSTAATTSGNLDLEWEVKKTTSRTSLVLFRSQYANGPISVRMLAPQDHIVINSCTVRVKMVDAASRQHCPQPTETFNTLHDNREYHRSWNGAHLWIHPRTCSCRLALVRKLEPTDVNQNDFYRICVSKWGFPVSRVARVRDILEAIIKAGVLGITDEAVREKYRDCQGLERMLAAMTEHHMVLHPQNRTMKKKVVMDADHRIIYLNSTFPGSFHDTHCWYMSELHEAITLRNRIGRNHLIADNGYPLSPWLIVPFTPTQLRECTEAKKKWNREFVKARISAERGLALYKGTWRSISRQGSGIIKREPFEAMELVNATAVLHNIALDAGCTSNYMDIEPDPDFEVGLQAQAQNRIQRASASVGDNYVEERAPLSQTQRLEGGRRRRDKLI